MKTFVDRKRAASGERDEEAGMPLASPQSLVAALRTPRTQQRSSEQQKELVAPVNEYDLYNPPLGRLTNIVGHEPKRWVPGMSFSLAEDREIVFYFAKTTPGWHAPMALDCINYENLAKEDVGNLNASKVAERLHLYVFKGTISRAELNDTSAIIEVAVFSRLIGNDSPGHYLGKAKLYFPKPYRAMSFYLDLSKLR
jgi:hypothetical protein